MRDLTNALQAALVDGGVRDKVTQTYRVKYDEYGRKTYVLMAQVFDDPMPPRKLTIRTRHTRGAALNKGGYYPKTRHPNKVYDAARTNGFRDPAYNNTKFGSLTGFYNRNEEAGGQGRAVKDVL